MLKCSKISSAIRRETEGTCRGPICGGAPEDQAEDASVLVAEEMAALLTCGWQDLYDCSLYACDVRHGLALSGRWCSA